MKLAREETILRNKQQNQMNTLLRKIQRDREEQVKHRQLDSNRLIQRNKNLLKDILEKQSTEQRRTAGFLKYALGKREDKTEKEVVDRLKKSKYDPRTDPLMPRLFRKVDASKSTITTHKRKGSHMISMEKFDNSKIYSKGAGHGSQRTYLCINPLRSIGKNREYAKRMQSVKHNETEKALRSLEAGYTSSQFAGTKATINSSQKQMLGLNLNQNSNFELGDTSS